MEDSEVIRNEKFHGTTFDRSQDGELLITFRLKEGMDEKMIKNELNSNFWFEKRSKDGNLNKIRGLVIYRQSPIFSLVTRKLF